MTFLGMGYLEVLVVLLVAFIFLGPERMVDAARLLGKAVREVRSMTADLPTLDLDEPPPQYPSRPRPERRPEPAPQEAAEETPDDGEQEAADGPVAFRPAGEPQPQPRDPEPPRAPPT